MISFCRVLMIRTVLFYVLFFAMDIKYSEKERKRIISLIQILHSTVHFETVFFFNIHIHKTTDWNIWHLCIEILLWYFLTFMFAGWRFSLMYNNITGEMKESLIDINYVLFLRSVAIISQFLIVILFVSFFLSFAFSFLYINTFALTSWWSLTQIV